MNPSTDPESPKLCNNCVVREQRRTPKMTVKEETIDILVKCPKKIQREIEEICIAKGMSFAEYFLNLHYREIEKLREREKPAFIPEEEEEEEGLELLKDVENILSETRKRGRPKKS
jgi:hypothetical protein